ncbi:MAG: flavin reductase [Saprospirales bacterium]|nr:MAG: flavin reductase [Saprospirales bacterium]
MINLNLEKILEMEGRYRATFINSLWGYRPVALLGTVDAAGQTNLCIVNSLFHLGANPPMCGMVFRPHNVERHSLENILEVGEYTINLMPFPLSARAHQTSAKYKREESEFDKVGLKPIWSGRFAAPFVGESPVRIGMELLRKIQLEENNTEMVIGKVKMIEIAENLVEEDGFVCHARGDILCGSGLDAYHSVNNGIRYTYAKPDETPRELDRFKFQ